jgi:ABC-type antimicrobial peptide transport system ATPase subunit
MKKDKILEAYKEVLSEAIPRKFYQGLWNKRFLGKKMNDIILIHKTDLDPRDEKLIRSEQKNYWKSMQKHEAEVLDALSKMDNVAAWWRKFLDKHGL